MSNVESWKTGIEPQARPDFLISTFIIVQSSL